MQKATSDLYEIVCCSEAVEDTANGIGVKEGDVCVQDGVCHGVMESLGCFECEEEGGEGS